jgi:hypothetical protein
MRTMTKSRPRKELSPIAGERLDQSVRLDLDTLSFRWNAAATGKIARFSYVSLYAVNNICVTCLALPLRERPCNCANIAEQPGPRRTSVFGIAVVMSLAAFDIADAVVKWCRN